MNRKLALLLVVFVLLLSFSPAWALERSLPRLVDGAGLLSGSEAIALESRLDEISQRQNMDTIIVTLDGLEGHHVLDLADDIFDYNGFGMGEARNGIILLLSMEERDWAISTSGYGITAFTDAGQKYITDIIVPEFSKGNFYKGFDSFVDQVDLFVSQARDGDPYDNHNLPKKPMSPIWYLLSLGGGALGGRTVTGSMKRDLQSVSKQKVAGNYLINTTMEPSKTQDLYLYNIIRRTPRAKSSGSPGGSTTRTSSSGRTHGGSSGKF